MAAGALSRRHGVFARGGKCSVKPVMALSLLLLAAPAGADPAAAPVERCVACHGADGIGLDPRWPNLAGQKRGYLVKQLRAFRDGTRTDAMMLPVVLELDDADINALAAFYAALPANPP